MSSRTSRAVESDATDALKIANVLKRLRKGGTGTRARGASTVDPVQLDLTVLDIWSADVKTESFCAKMKTVARWTCPTDHAEEAMQEGGDSLDTDWEPEWFPRIAVASTTERLVESVAFSAARDPSGTVKITGEWVFIVTVLEGYDLHAFPFDVQDFNVVVRIENAAMGLTLSALPSIHKRGNGNGLPADSTENDVPVRVEAAGLELPDFRTLASRNDGSNWLKAPALYRCVPSSHEVHVVLLYERNPLFYMLNYMLLLFALTSCGALGWAIEWAAVEDRLAFDVTLLLTAVAFKQVLAGIVPPISYLTRLDVYALTSLGFLLLSSVMHATIGFLIDDCRESASSQCTFHVAGFSYVTAVTLDNVFFWSYVAMWLLSNGLFTLSVYRHRWQQRRAFSPENAEKAGFAPAQIETGPREWYEAALEQDPTLAYFGVGGDATQEETRRPTLSGNV